VGDGEESLARALLSVLPGLAHIRLEELGEARLLERVDEKYLLPVALCAELLQRASAGYRILSVGGQAVFRYSTLYLDTEERALYQAHQLGRPGRQKLRLRRYLDSGLGFLELKTRTRKGGTRKLREELSLARPGEAGFEGLLLPAFLSGAVQSRLQLPASQLAPALWTNFRRVTLVGTGVPERVTLDFGLEVALARGELSPSRTPERLPGGVCLLEVKRGGHRQSSLLRTLLREARVRPLSFSKYCVGLSLLSPELRKNRFLPQHRALRAHGHSS